MAELTEKVPQDVTQQRIVFNDEDAHWLPQGPPAPNQSKHRAMDPEMPKVGSEKNSGMTDPRGGPALLERA